MAIFRSVLFISLLFSAIILGCSADSETGAKSAAIPSDYSHYRKNGISVAFPDSWEFSFDDSPSLYADREIGFRVSDFSTASLLILDERDRSTADVMDHFVDEFQIHSAPLLTDYKRSPASIAGYTGEQITWTDTLAGKSDFEFTVIKVQGQPYSAFVIFNLSDQDIEETGVHKDLFVQGLQLD